MAAVAIILLTINIVVNFLQTPLQKFYLFWILNEYPSESIDIPNTICISHQNVFFVCVSKRASLSRFLSSLNLFYHCSPLLLFQNVSRKIVAITIVTRVAMLSYTPPSEGISEKRL